MQTVSFFTFPPESEQYISYDGFISLLSYRKGHVMQQNTIGSQVAEIDEELQQKLTSNELSENETSKDANCKKKFRPFAVGLIAIIGSSIILSTAYWFVAEVEKGNDWALGLSNAFGGEGSGHKNRIQFDLSKAVIPKKEILSGGPPKDGIPAISNPILISVKEATYLKPDDRIIGFVHNQIARAYPLKILNYHEIVNDLVGEIPLAITYCPLCDSVAIFDRRTELGERELGVSGLLYNSNVLMYDRSKKTESLWSQVKAKGVSGPGADKSLKTLPVELTTWSNWTERYPNTKVLSRKTGHKRDYSKNPYKSYFSHERLMFPARPKSKKLHQKERVLGVWAGNVLRAYPTSAFSNKRNRIEDTIDGKNIVIKFDPKSKSLRVIKADVGVQWIYSLWFAWNAFHPETELFD